jgi:hypothetical protein
MIFVRAKFERLSDQISKINESTLLKMKSMKSPPLHFWSISQSSNLGLVDEIGQVMNEIVQVLLQSHTQSTCPGSCHIDVLFLENGGILSLKIVATISSQPIPNPDIQSGFPRPVVLCRHHPPKSLLSMLNI